MMRMVCVSCQYLGRVIVGRSTESGHAPSRTVDFGAGWRSTGSREHRGTGLLGGEPWLFSFLGIAYAVSAVW